MLVLTRIALKRGFDLEINMLGRWAVWPVMSALALSFITETWVSDALLYLGTGDDAGCDRPVRAGRIALDARRWPFTLNLNLRIRAILASPTTRERN